MKIGILQTGHSPDETRKTLGDYGEMFTRFLQGQNFTFETFSVVDGVFPKNLQAADAWLITGSKHGAYEDHDWIPPLEDLIREIRAKDIPLVGVCFGHQIIAKALGGKVVKYDKGWSIGRQTYDINGTPMALNAWHQDQVVELPEGAQVIASSDFCKNAGLLIGDKIMTIQPHPEFQSDMVDALIEHRGRGNIDDTLIEKAQSSLSMPTDSQKIADLFAEILRKGAVS